ncbi:HNH endonuclease [Roseinatronobacter sp. NSM]|uniref:HNH endonuclease n=1 Tax=Roseinatronobacter sp. NSM TaxID=3457785 RepID=UPI00403757EE
MMVKDIRPIRIDGDVAYVPLTKGYEAIIDAADVPLVEGYNWTAKESGETAYAYRKTRKGGVQEIYYMHRVICSAKAGKEVDHKDMNGLNNRRNNLRPASRSQNISNTRVRRDNKSSIKGVQWNANAKKYAASIHIEGKKKHLGYFQNAEEAHAAYCCAASKLHGEFARFE